MVIEVAYVMPVFQFIVLFAFHFVCVCGKVDLSMLWMNWYWSPKDRFAMGFAIVKICNKHSRRVLFVINNDGNFFCSSRLQPQTMYFVCNTFLYHFLQFNVFILELIKKNNEHGKTLICFEVVQFNPALTHESKKNLNYFSSRGWIGNINKLR